MRGELILMATRSMREYVDRVAHQLETFPDFHGIADPKRIIGSMATATFADGEMEVEVNSSIRGKDVFLFSAAARNEQGIGVNEAKMELYHTIDALKRAAAGRITLVEPYCSSSRSDRTTRRNSVGFWMHYKTLAGLGVDHWITFQLHSDKSRTVVDPSKCGIDDVPVTPLLMEDIVNEFVKSPKYLDREVHEDWLFCSVDAGGESVARSYAQAFGTKLVIAHKQRNYQRVNTVDSINILSDTSIEGKTVWIVDDMIDTGGSVYALVKELNARGVAAINIAIVHPVLSDPAVERLRELHETHLLQNLVVTDTIACPPDLREALPFLHVVSSARLSAEIVMRMHQEQSLSPFFDTFNAWDYLSSLKLFI